MTFRKAVGKPSVACNDAMEEALCFGWIDGVRKTAVGRQFGYGIESYY